MAVPSHGFVRDSAALRVGHVSQASAFMSVNPHGALDTSANWIHESEPRHMGTYPAAKLLARFIGDKGLTQAAAADQLSIVPAALSMYLKRRQRPRADIRTRIAKWSEGAVPEDAWLTAKERAGLASTDPVVVPEPEKSADDNDSSNRSETLS